MAIDGQRVRELREAKGWSQPELARLSNVSQQTIDLIERGQTKRTKFVMELATALGVPAAEIDPSYAALLPDTFSPQIVPGRDLVGDRNFPIYAAARGGPEGHQIVSFEAIDFVKRPAILESVKDAYGLYIVGESMIPAFEPGDMALVHPHLPPARDKNVVLYHLPPFTEAEAEAMVKRLLRYDDRDWHLRQFNPGEGEERDFSVPRVDWKFCHRIVGKYEAR